MFKKDKTPVLDTDQDIMAAIAQDYLHDRKVKRRWKTMFIVLFLAYIATVAYIAMSGGAASYNKPHTALVELNGPIGIAGGVDAQLINKSLRNAFNNQMVKGVVLSINSPGGSPVQSADMNTQIRELRAQYPNVPFHVVVPDMCASGGYFVAVAADQIYANRSSIVGSIGVRMDSFGFVGAMQKLGIERRSLTAGKNKSILDPFLPVKQEQQAHAHRMLDQVHQHFIEVVKQGRGDRLSDNPDLFTGLFWSGEEAKRLGLIDDFGNVDSVARDVIGAEHVVNYTVQPDLFEELTRQLGASIGVSIANVVIGGNYQLK